MSKDMTWEELCKKAKEMGYEYWKDNPHLTGDNIQFYKNGTICVYIYVEDGYYSDYYEVAWDRTPDQMLAIMEALR